MSEQKQFNLKGSMLMLLGLTSIFGAYKLIVFLWLLIVGATANVALSGDVTVPAGINTSITNEVTNVSDGFTSLAAGDTVVLGLIGLAVILTLFWPMISGFMPKGKKGGMN